MSARLRRVCATAGAGLVAGLLAVPVLSSPAGAAPPPPEPGCTTGPVETFTNSDGTTIDDDDTVARSLEVTDPGRVAWLRVRTDITHTAPGDLVVTVTSPSGHEVTLSSQEGGSADNAFDGTWWDDDAGDTNPPGSARETQYSVGVPEPTIAPEQALGNFRGESAQGDWTLTVSDVASGDTGSLDGWALELSTYTSAVPSVIQVHGTPGSTGVVGGGAMAAFTSTVASTTSASVVSAEVRLDAAAVDPDSGAWVEANLVSPSGTNVTLSRYGLANGLGGFDGTTFTDAAGGPLVEAPVVDLAEVAPLEPMAALRGENPNGTWRLEVLGADGPVQVTGWRLTLSLASCGQDTRLTAASAVDHVAQGGTMAYAVTASNVRATATTGTLVSLTVPPGTQLVAASSTQGGCSGGSCNLGVLEGGASASVIYVLKAVSAGMVRPSVTLTQADPDLTPGDNTVAFSTTVDAPVLTTDTTKPGVVVLLQDGALHRVAKKGVPLLLGGSEAGRLSLTLKLSAKAAKALRLPRTIGTATTTLGHAGTAKLKLQVAKKHRARLAASTKPVKLFVSVSLTDAAGNVGTSAANHTYSD